jgi:hypothetical protein
MRGGDLVSDQLALEVLFDAVEKRFADDGTPCEFKFGWREPNRQGNYAPANITVTPGDPSGSLGEVVGPRYPGQLPARPLAGLWELFTVFIQAQDPGAPEDERAQYHATRLLYDAFVRAVYLAAFGNFEIKSQVWITKKNERRYGAGLRVVGGILAVIPDAVVTLAPVDVKADLNESLNSTSDGVVEILPLP